MKPSTAFHQLLLLLALAISLAALLGARALDSNAGMSTSRLFASQLVPTSTVAAPRSSPTPAPIAYPTATPGGSRAPAGATHKIYLPLFLQWYPKIVYGWKGVGHPAEGAQLGANSSNSFWGIYPDWWYNWGYSGPFMSSQIHSAAETLAGLEAGLRDQQYVPMVWCMADVGSSFPTPTQVADLARRYPGRVWLMFNEPDNAIDQCGLPINSSYHYIDQKKWSELGTYLAQQYILYYDAIKAADRHARLFPLGLLQLPMPNLQGQWNDGRGTPIWNAFLAYLKNPPDHIARSLDGIAIHVYPISPSTFHTPLCRYSYLDYPCVQEALPVAYRFFQDDPTTAGKPIWITEIGSLIKDNLQPWTTTRDGFESPMLTWFNQHIKPGQDCQYINAVAWFSTHYPSSTVSNLLNYYSGHAGERTPVGDTWRDTACANCQCPGPDCQ
ncbi:MAG: hypothetical protein CVU38_18770 [Chloroflexi bacterium HGW-Chloroflexi-1]|nr:MAG: hypothetical protein CVU38_18770 [Chloroflexi bacterium HGW-Chloroflexi-1]